MIVTAMINILYEKKRGIMFKTGNTRGTGETPPIGPADP
jgi:hypothetical protein